jgi:thiol-disulfide isomerase/thioredoxin
MRPIAFALSLTLAFAASAPADEAPAPRAKSADPGPKEAPKLRLPAEAGVGRLVPDVALTDLAGKSGKLSDFKASKLTVVAFTNSTCPVCKKFAPALQRLEKEWADKGVSFLFVNPTKTDKVGAHGFAGRYVHDTDGTLTAAFGASSTAEVFVLDSARTVQYRGAISDQYGLGYALDAPRNNYLATALTDLLAGKSPVVAATSAPGCELSPDAAKAPKVALTYHARIERIMLANCVECHRAGGVAPFALDTYDDVVANKGMIRKTVEKGTMPPWFAAAPKKGEHSLFANDRTLSADDKADLFAWLAGDTKKGDPADAPLPRKFDSGWAIGKPDAILQLPKPVAIKAEGVMPYQVVRVETSYDEDRWVRAIEVQPTDRAVTHHVLVFAVQRGRPLGGEASGFFAVYVPGNNNLIYPEGYAKKLPKGCDLVFQLHYTPNGKATTDQTKIGLVFAKEKPRNEVHTFGIAHTGLAIPAGEGNHKVVASDTFDGQILAFFPHAHLRGKAMKYELRAADGTTRTLLDVPHYDFNWQLQYRFREPLSVKMDELVYTAWYDNSKSNPANPDPTKRVRWGPQTSDEMHLGYVEFVFSREPGKEWKFPQGGVAIPEQYRLPMAGFDKNGNGRFELEEFEAMPPAVKKVVTQHLSRTLP